MATTTPVTGLSQLGGVLMQGTADYANQRLRREAEERQRAQQLADLQSQRAFQQTQLTDADRRARDLALWQARQQRIQELIAKGYLAQEQAADEAAIVKADAAERERTVRTRTQADETRENMQTSANEIGQQVNQLSDAAAQVQARLAAIPTRPASPDPRRVETVAAQLASEAGEDPKSDAVRAKYRSAAEKALTNAAMQEFFIAQEAADALKVSLNGYTQQIAALTRRLENYESKGVVPKVSPPAQSLQQNFAPASQQMRPAPADIRDAAAGIGQPPSAPAPSAAPSASPQGYGGLMALAPEARTLATALENPVGAAELGLRAGLNPIAQALNYVVGGERRVREGDAERAAAMAAAEERFRNPRPLPVIPSFMGYSSTPSPPLPPLPPLPPARKNPAQSPAFQFSDSFAPGY